MSVSEYCSSQDSMLCLRCVASCDVSHSHEVRVHVSTETEVQETALEFPSAEGQQLEGFAK